MNTNISFGNTIKTLREQKKLTLREVAEYLQIDTSMLGKIEKNNRKPTKDLIEKFSKLFNVNKKDLIIRFLSDNIVYQVIEEEDSIEILKLAEEKIEYLKRDKSS